MWYLVTSRALKSGARLDRRLSRLSATTSVFYQSAAWNLFHAGDLVDPALGYSNARGGPDGHTPPVCRRASELGAASVHLPRAGAVSLPGTILAAVDYLSVPSLSGSAQGHAKRPQSGRKAGAVAFLFGTD